MTIECGRYSRLFYKMNLLYKEMNGAFEEETGISYTKLEILYQISSVIPMNLGGFFFLSRSLKTS